MTEKEFDKEIDALNKRYKSANAVLHREYAFSNNLVKVGDLIKDFYKIIKVEKITWTYGAVGSKLPYCVYKGIRMKKGSGVAVRQADNTIFQPNLEYINGNIVDS